MSTFFAAFSATPRQRLREYCRSVLGRRLDKRTAEEQDWMRCRLTSRVWTAFIGFGLSRILTQQLRVLFRGERQHPEMDATAIVMATAGLLLQLMPSLLNPRSLDPWYIVTSLLLNLTFVRSEIDAREAFILLHGLQTIVATLAKRTRCSLFCFLRHLGTDSLDEQGAGDPVSRRRTSGAYSSHFPHSHCSHVPWIC